MIVYRLHRCFSTVSYCEIFHLQIILTEISKIKHVSTFILPKLGGLQIDTLTKQLFVVDIDYRYQAYFKLKFQKAKLALLRCIQTILTTLFTWLRKSAANFTVTASTKNLNRNFKKTNMSCAIILIALVVLLHNLRCLGWMVSHGSRVPLIGLFAPTTLVTACLWRHCSGT